MKTKYYGYLIVFIFDFLTIYHSLWVYVKVNKFIYIKQNILFLQPFLNADDILNNFFPDKYWALAIPAYGASLTYSFSFIFLGWIFILSYRERKPEDEILLNKNEGINHNKSE